MYHLVSRTCDRTLLFRTWAEGAALWQLLAHHIPGPTAMCAMPDHIHVQHTRDVRAELATVLSSWARRLNRRRGWSGPRFAPLPPSHALASADKIRRSIRYIHLNPCRPPCLVEDPLGWPFSTYRDALGLTLAPSRRPDPDPLATHAATCRDDFVRAADLPLAHEAVPSLESLAHATSAALRTPLTALRQRGPTRTLFIHAARALTDAHPAEIGARVDVHERSVRRHPARPGPATALVARLADDPRFFGLTDQDLRTLPRWSGYRLRGYR